MKLLLDTHVWLWWNSQPDRLSSETLRHIGSARNEVFLSAASIWEMAIKKRLGELPLPESVASYVARRIESDAFTPLPVTLENAAGVETLELLHRDPFDRILVIQARQAGLRLLTVDENVLAYGHPTVDARP